MKKAFWVCVMCGNTGVSMSYYPYWACCNVWQQGKVWEKLGIAIEAAGKPEPYVQGLSPWLETSSA